MHALRYPLTRVRATAYAARALECVEPMPLPIPFTVLPTFALVAVSRVPAFGAHTMPLRVRRILVTRRAIDEAVTGGHGSLHRSASPRFERPPATPGPSAQQRPDLLWFESSGSRSDRP